MFSAFLSLFGFILAFVVVIRIAKKSGKDESKDEYDRTPDDEKHTYDEWLSFYYDGVKPPESSGGEDTMTKEEFEEAENSF